MLRTFTRILAVIGLAAPALAQPSQDGRASVAGQIQKQLHRDLTKLNQADIYMAIKPVDIDGDGLQDWQVDWNEFGSAWCGTGGCRYQLWLGRAKGGPKLVFDRQMRELTIAQREGRVVFVFDFHGGECGGFGSQECPGEFTWDAGAKKLVLLPTPARHTAVEDPLLFNR
jgi:hypothetical protein